MVLLSSRRKSRRKSMRKSRRKSKRKSRRKSFRKNSSMHNRQYTDAELVKEIVYYLSMSQANPCTTFDLFNNPSLFPIANSLNRVARLQVREFVESIQQILRQYFMIDEF